jgi:hypothetical protein
MSIERSGIGGSFPSLYCDSRSFFRTTRKPRRCGNALAPSRVNGLRLGGGIEGRRRCHVR